MAEKKFFRSRIGKGAVALALAGAMAAGGAGTAFADGENYSWFQYYDQQTSSNVAATVSAVTPSTDLLTTYGVRAGSAGGDFLGLTNTNFDFTPGSASATTPYTGYTTYVSDNTPYRLDGLAIWASSANEDANPYYANLLYYALTGADPTHKATTWMSNPSTSSWGDSNGYQASNDGVIATAGMEYNGGPDIVFGANKYTNWQNAKFNGIGSGTNFESLVGGENATAEFVSNDATNIWTQVYTMRALAARADANSKSTRYNNNATAAAQSYQDNIQGNMLYVASKIEDEPAAKKTVAYLYAIDADGTGYFFTPTASGLTNGGDKGKGVEPTPEEVRDQGLEIDPNSAIKPDLNYAANNPTINMGYMGVLPFITETFDSGQAFNTETVYNDAKRPAYDEGQGKWTFSGSVYGSTDLETPIPGIIMKVEDIYKANPACVVDGDSDDDVLADVDVIIFNSTAKTTLQNGTSGGMNLSGVNNDYQSGGLTANVVSSWASDYGFEGRVLAGDDFGTSSNQKNFGANNSTMEAAPVLYCQRNYTCDKNARAAWAFAEVYPEFYGGNSLATYCYWVDTIYHVDTKYVPSVAMRMTNASSAMYGNDVASMVSGHIAEGYDWQADLASDSTWLTTYGHYNGSSRASYYSDFDDSQEKQDYIGIFGTSSLPELVS